MHQDLALPSIIFSLVTALSLFLASSKSPFGALAAPAFGPEPFGVQPRNNYPSSSPTTAVQINGTNSTPYDGTTPPITGTSSAYNVLTPVPTINGPANKDVVATGWYYPGWLGHELPPSQISWNKYTALTFAFATTTNVSTIDLNDESAVLLPTFVKEAHDHNVDALLSIGGWSGSMYYSTAVGTAQNRTAFVKAVVDIALKYGLDGIDFDWEYPGKQGIGCNAISESDSDNFLLFLQELRKDDEGSKLTLTAAVGLAPFVGARGSPMTDVKDFATVLDHIAIMNYDVWGSWSPSAGPNAPLDDSCAPTKEGSATSAVKAWTNAGFPASKIVLGIAAYGHSFYVDSSTAVDASGNLTLYPQFNKAKQPLGDSDVPGEGPSTDQCGNVVGVGGTFNFQGLIAGGFLDATGAAASGVAYRYDNCSQTPFIYKASEQTLVSYDDRTSLAAKGKFINDNGLAGFAVWHVAGDSDDILLSAISDAMGIIQVCS